MLWFFGADAVGKSVVGWEAYSQLVAAGVPAAYVDLDHLGFCDPRPVDLTGLVAANLAAVWGSFARQGIRWLVVSGIVVSSEDRRRFSEHLPHCHLDLVLLRARPATIRNRIVRRREIEAQRQRTRLGEEVLRELDDYASRSARFAELLDRQGLTDLVVDTDERPPAAVAAESLSRVGISLSPGAVEGDGAR